SLDLRNKSDLADLNTHQNILTLSNLYTVSLLPKLTNAIIGTQTLELQNIEFSIPYSLKGEMNIGGNKTTFSIIRENKEAIENTDYKLDYVNETITFLTGGRFEVKLSNNSIVSNEEYPAVVIIPFEVKGPDQAIIKWRGSITKMRTIYFSATNGKKVTIDWGNGTKETITATGNTMGSSKVYNSSSEFTATITGEYGCNITYLDVKEQEVQSLDLTNNSMLYLLNCYGNELTTLDLSKNDILEIVYCHQNQLQSLTISSPLLNFLNCQNNQLETLDLSKNPKLMNFECSNNKLKEINTTGLETLATLYCKNNELTVLNVPESVSILSCENNQIEKLDLSKCLNLSKLNCFSNKLTYLTIARSIRDGVNCYDNQLSLAMLYSIQTKMSSSGPQNFGTQTYETKKAFTNNSFSLSGNMKLGTFGSSVSNIVVKKGENIAVENTDYTLDFSSQTITFYTTGNYELTITNDAINSNEEYPTVVIIPLIVTTRSQQTITFLPIEEKRVGDADFSPGATASSGLEVTYISSNTNVATIVDNKIHIINEGKTTIKAIQEGNDEYEPATYVDQILTVLPSLNSIDEAENITLSIYPNPVSSVLNIKHTGTQINRIEIVDINGRTVMSENNLIGENIHVSHLSKGVYLLRINIDGQISIQKFIKR
ncbi:T9SS type A sorting domain-containing protein, partial [Bacteroidales bacterium OttesenSCG-928-M11]|nr:T9SS type A sorting domain-containing protein [Bacteroidales bacterium OttesenSCG-928-M11]